MVAHDSPATGMPSMIGKMLSIHEWLSYVAEYQFGSLMPTKVVLHHTWRPTVAQWRGLASMRGMQTYYGQKGWTSAPHIYVGPDGIWLFTPLREIGIHANMGNGSRAAGWYSIGVEMVGDYDHVRPSGAIWEATKAVIGGLSRKLAIAPQQLIAFHREYTTTKSCPGWAVTKEWVISEVNAWLTAQTAQTPDAPILGPASGTAAQAIAYLVQYANRSYMPAAIREIVQAYQRIGDAVGLDWFLAIAQLAHETGHLTSFWSQRPQRNPAGIGVDGRAVAGVPTDPPPQPTGWAYNTQRNRWEKGLSFPSWVEDSVPAHLGRLLAYALRDEWANAEQRQLIAQALAWRPLPADRRGVALTYVSLNGKWAVPGTSYGQTILALAKKMRGEEEP